MTKLPRFNHEFDKYFISAGPILLTPIIKYNFTIAKENNEGHMEIINCPSSDDYRNCIIELIHLLLKEKEVK